MRIPARRAIRYRTRIVADTPSSDVVTEGIRVQAAAQFVPDHSDPSRKHYQYVYRIVLTNQGQAPARLRTRHWVILDAHNERREVRGDGVVGEMPHLQPGETFHYESGCPLPTEWGTMEGSYEMERDDGERFQVAVGRFFLAPSNPPILMGGE